MMFRPFPLASVGKAVAGTVIIAVVSVYLVIIAPVFAVFIPLPVAYVTARHGWFGGVVVAVVSALLLYPVMGPGIALMTFLITAGLGLTLGWALRSGWRFSRSLVVMSAALLTALVLYCLVLWLGYGLSYAAFKQDWYEVFNSVTATYRQAGLNAATAEEITRLAHGVVDVFAYLAPGILGMVAVLGAACTAGLAYLIFPRLRKPQPVGMSLSGFRMHWAVAYVSIIGLALLLFTRSGEGWKAYVFYAGIDLLLVSQTLFFLQALGVLRWLGAARQWRPGPRVLAFVSAVLAQFFQLTGLVGLLDTWIDYRKRFALKGSGPGPLG